MILQFYLFINSFSFIVCALKELWEFVLDADSSMEEEESQTETAMETT